MARVIYDAWKKGAKFDGWTDFFDVGMWKAAFGSNRISMRMYAEAIPTGSTLPWDHINKGVSKSFLLTERQKAYSEKTTADCRTGLCYGCGVKKISTCEEPEADAGQSESVIKKIHTEQRKAEGKRNEDKKDGQPIRIRIRYKKYGMARFLSHLDLVRIFYRAFRAAGIAISYTQGFNPKPKVSFSPPLSLGYTSNAEYLDIELASAVHSDPGNVLNAYLPEGVHIVETKEITGNVKSLTATLNRARYEIDISGVNMDGDSFYQNLNRFISRDSIKVERVVKGKQKTVNIKPFIDTIDQKNGTLFIQTKTIESRSVRVEEILTQLFPDSKERLKGLPVHRTAQLIYDQKTLLNPLECIS
jgi:radical SAM-linked protein